MWFAIILPMVVIISWFFFDRYRQCQRIKKEGGMEKKYELLINLILASPSFPPFEIHKTGCDYVYIASVGPAASTVIRLVLTFKTLSIRYELNNRFADNIILTLKYPKNESQEYIFNHLNTEVTKYIDHNPGSKDIDIEGMINELK